MKRSILLLFLFALCLSACGEIPPTVASTPAASSEPTSEAAVSTPGAEPENSAAPVPVITPTPSAEPTPTPGVTPTPAPSAEPMPTPSLAAGLGQGSGFDRFDPPDSGNESGAALEAYDFEAQYVRTNGYHAGVQYPCITVIRSREELDAYYEANRGLYDLERREGGASGFLDACDKYDEAYFDDNALILILLEESSGSVRHEVTDVSRDTDSGGCCVTIRRRVPDVGTCDMAEWHILVEVRASQLTDDAVRVVFQ